MKQHYYKIGLVLWCIALIAVFCWQLSFLKIPPHFVYSTQTHSSDAQLVPPTLIKSDISRTNLSVHAATITPFTQNGEQKLMSAWFAGSREGAKDVKIYASFLTLVDLDNSNPTTHLWSEPIVILTPEQLSLKSKNYIKKLGNPVLYQADDKTIHLFVVATSYAGWAASKIYHLTSYDGKDFVFKQVLPLSPLLNVSHLVRVPPIALKDGGFYLPIYHELANKFEVILRFDGRGNLIGKLRPNELTKTLQPSLAPISENECIMARRHRHSVPLLIQECHQGGLEWGEPQQSNVNNDNNSLNVVHFNQHNYLIHNQAKEDNSRYYLYLSKIIKNVNQFEVQKKLLLDTGDAGEVSYPTTLAIDGKLHIVYTHDRKSIRHIVLNTNFLEEIDACGQSSVYDDAKLDEDLIAKTTLTNQHFCGDYK